MVRKNQSINVKNVTTKPVSKEIITVIYKQKNIYEKWINPL